MLGQINVVPAVLFGVLFVVNDSRKLDLGSKGSVLSEHHVTSTTSSLLVIWRLYHLLQTKGSSKHPARRGLFSLVSFKRLLKGSLFAGLASGQLSIVVLFLEGHDEIHLNLILRGVNLSGFKHGGAQNGFLGLEERVLLGQVLLVLLTVFNE